MKTADVVRHFGNRVKTAKALGVTKSAVSQWGEVVPERIAYKTQIITGGALRVDPSVYSSSHAESAA